MAFCKWLLMSAIWTTVAMTARCAGIPTRNRFLCRSAKSAVSKRSDLYASTSVFCWEFVSFAFRICMPVFVAFLCWTANAGTPCWPFIENAVSVLASDQRHNSENPNECFEQHLKEKKEEIWLSATCMTKAPINRKFQKAKRQHKNATTFDYSMIAGQPILLSGVIFMTQYQF